MLFHQEKDTVFHTTRLTDSNLNEKMARLIKKVKLQT